MRKLIAIILLFSMLFCYNASANTNIAVCINGKYISLSSPPVIINDRVMIPIREIAENLGCKVVWYDNVKLTEIYNSTRRISLTLNSNVVTVRNEQNGYRENVTLDLAPTLHNEKTYLPLRQIIELLGGIVYWNDVSRVIYINYGNQQQTQTYYNYDVNAVAPSINNGNYTTSITNNYTPSVTTGSAFYFQNETKWQFPNYGSGYCWTCSYAMLVSNVTGTQITPADIALVNQEAGGNGSYCNHFRITQKFGVRFTPALNSTSQYYGGYDSSRGATLINNPTKDDNVVRLALKEALEKHPAGVMVRYEIYPHTMVAVKYENGLVYFNDPMRTDYEYKDSSDKQGVPFDQTCLRSYKLSDIEFMQAIIK